MPLSVAEYKKVLEASVYWNGCDRIRQLTDAIRSSLKSIFSLAATTEAKSACLEDCSEVLRYSEPAVVQSFEGGVYNVTIVSRSGSKVDVTISGTRSTLKLKDRALLDELTKHMVSAYEQVSRIEALKLALGRAKSEDIDRRFSSPSVMTDLPFDSLTRRERETIALLSEGMSNGEMASRMEVSRRTVEKHLESVYRKLGLENRYQLIQELSR